MFCPFILSAKGKSTTLEILEAFLQTLHYLKKKQGKRLILVSFQ